MPIFAPLYSQTANCMIVTFDKEYLLALYLTGKGDKKHRFQPDIVKRYQKRIDTLKPKSVIRPYGCINVQLFAALHALAAHLASVFSLT